MDQKVTPIELRAWQESDLPVLTQMRNDVVLQAQLLATARGSDDSAVRAWLARRTEGADRIFRVISNPASNEPLGYLQADRIEMEPQAWRFGICLNTPFQGAGRGTAALQALEHDLVHHFGARRVELEVDKANVRAIRCYTQLGYAICAGDLRQVIVCDQPREVIAMAKRISSNDVSP